MEFKILKLRITCINSNLFVQFRAFFSYIPGNRAIRIDQFQPLVIDAQTSASIVALAFNPKIEIIKELIMNEFRRYCPKLSVQMDIFIFMTSIYCYL